MIKLFNKILHKFSHPLRGLWFSAKTDLSIQLDILVGIALAIFGYIMQPLSAIELTLLVLSWSLIIITELQNTALEAALDRIHPEQHHEIGISKDVAAASVFMSLMFTVFSVCVVLLY